MQIRYQTNLDHYYGSDFPQLDIGIIPRKGEKVHVLPECAGRLMDLNLPTCLEVYDVDYHHNRVVIELWYSEIQVQMLKMNNNFLK